MITTGTTAKATASDTAVELFSAANAAHIGFHHLRILNTGSVAGFYTVDGGTNWGYLPANASVTDEYTHITGAVQMKRIAGGSNLSGVYASLW